MEMIGQEISAGGVVFKKEQDVFRVVLYCRNNATQWCLPKGKIESGETKEEAALREVKEETGLTGEIIRHINDIRYEYFSSKRNLKIKRTVHFFLIQHTGGTIGDHENKTEAVQWFSLDDAIAKATHVSEQSIIKKAKDSLP